MKRMNLRDVPDDVYGALTSAAEAKRQSLSAYVVDRLAEIAEVTRLADYVSAYRVPEESGVTLEEATAAVRQVREAS
ncbi:MAG: antitoxin [Actinomycetota bacterium]|nr:antitoxin [Actinomycetota bacterium]